VCAEGVALRIDAFGASCGGTAAPSPTAPEGPDPGERVRELARQAAVHMTVVKTADD